MSTAVLTTADREGWWWASPVRTLSVRSSLVSVRIPRHPAFTPSGAFAVHVLDPGQEALADRFAADPTDFDGVDVECGFGPVPLLRGVARRMECRPVHTLATSGTVLLIGEVVREPGELARPA